MTDPIDERRGPRREPPPLPTRRTEDPRPRELSPRPASSFAQPVAPPRTPPTMPSPPPQTVPPASSPPRPAQATHVARPTPEDFEERLRALVEAHSAERGNVSCLACEGCERCSESTFLRDCTDVARSHYCTRCVDCSDCSHCTDTTRCYGCSHCEACERCTQCAYLVRSVGCTQCSYCYGCVGLTKKDFHILNEPYDRQTYFAIVAELELERARRA